MLWHLQHCHDSGTLYPYCACKICPCSKQHKAPLGRISHYVVHTILATLAYTCCKARHTVLCLGTQQASAMVHYNRRSIQPFLYLTACMFCSLSSGILMWVLCQAQLIVPWSVTAANITDNVLSVELAFKPSFASEVWRVWEKVCSGAYIEFTENSLQLTEKE